jgi:hypothetical protein
LTYLKQSEALAEQAAVVAPLLAIFREWAVLVYLVAAAAVVA